MSYNEAAVILGVPRCFHAADAEVTDCDCLQVSHLILRFQSRNAFRLERAPKYLDIRSLSKPELVSTNMIGMLMR